MCGEGEDGDEHKSHDGDCTDECMMADTRSELLLSVEQAFPPNIYPPKLQEIEPNVFFGEIDENYGFKVYADESLFAVVNLTTQKEVKFNSIQDAVNAYISMHASSENNENNNENDIYEFVGAEKVISPYAAAPFGKLKNFISIDVKLLEAKEYINIKFPYVFFETQNYDKISKEMEPSRTRSPGGKGGTAILHGFGIPGYALLIQEATGAANADEFREKVINTIKANEGEISRALTN